LGRSKTGIFLPTRLDGANRLEAVAENRAGVHVKNDPGRVSLRRLAVIPLRPHLAAQRHGDGVFAAVGGDVLDLAGLTRPAEEC
jgi:hypothetical protein